MFAEEFLVAADHSVAVGSVDSGAIIQQLSQSFAYRRVMESLQALPTELGVDPHRLLQAVAEEAIRLTIAAFPAADSGHVANAITVLETPIEELQTTTLAPTVTLFDADALDNDLFESIATVTQDVAPTHSNPIVQLVDRYKAKRETAKAITQVLTRADILVQIGEQIQIEREDKGLTIAQLHARTFIPMYHLQALEAGHVEQLPEDVYLRGFLRRIENALGLEVSTLIDQLPSESAAVNVLPVWARERSASVKRGVGGLDVNPTHLYVTYAAMMAGGVCWLSNQQAPTTKLPDLSNYEPRAEAPSTKAFQPLKSKSTLNARMQKGNPVQAKSINVGSAKQIAPPEVLR
jgi:cytoskeleton protein RodZ